MFFFVFRLDPENTNIPNILGDSYQTNFEPLMSPSSARSSNSSRRPTAKKSSNSEKKNPPSNKTPTPKQSAVISTTNNTTPPTVISASGGGLADLKTCQTCASNQDQHLLALCDVCKFYYHLACLNPPLPKMPKKTRVRVCFPVCLRNRLIYAGLEPVLSHSEKSCIVSYEY